ncbi:MAG: hypothetical protein ONB24_08675 [candidate division KSB1 bacterium]|nr:hypothetical protein [candidate division KSB1 bacterium]
MLRTGTEKIIKMVIYASILVGISFTNSKAYDRWWNKNFSIGVNFGRTSNAAAGYSETNANMPLDAFYAYNSFGPSDQRPIVWAGTDAELKQITLSLFKQRLFIAVGSLQNSPRVNVKKSKIVNMVPTGNTKFVWEGEFKNEFTYISLGYNMPILTDRTLGRFSLGVAIGTGKPEVSEMSYNLYQEHVDRGSISFPHRGKLSFTDQSVYFGSFILKYEFPYFPISLSYNLNYGLMGSGERGHWTWNKNGYIDSDATNQMGVRSLQSFGLVYYSFMPNISVCFPF